ncbi:hypothetical protein H310_13264 [Aphanomyces invadans]|uniref:Uncharacterized protein n=1 Tax=Aphanomyces invadans TaxID=157072 RepID=A0A024TEC2_9STRA|nr:hypothetical protein H310_13264 [Aphanomyces invadans]ETV92364.1 hypothetical protein H310_13264 [Aphanomyces invadans]RHY31223.1 hypothetical protein DYB32_003669 [Aphanomyces invadans]|eukprot:XP_008878915.1 hypothetical protein H310_13264 [Aphanomyces invadans]
MILPPLPFLNWTRPPMSDAEDIFGGLACAAFCGICCAVAAEEDKKERELIAQIDAKGLNAGGDPVVRKGGRQQPIQVNPVAVTTFVNPQLASGRPGPSSLATSSSAH